MLRHAYLNILSDKVNAHPVRAQILFGLQESQGGESWVGSRIAYSRRMEDLLADFIKYMEDPSTQGYKFRMQTSNLCMK